MFGLELDPEATAAIVGAAVGVVLSSVVQLVVAAYVRRRERREAAGLIHWELGTNWAAAEAAALYGNWPTRDGAPRRAAWEALGGKLLAGRRRRERVTAIAAAYSSLDDIAYAATEGVALSDPKQALVSIRAGTYEAGRLAGYTRSELAARTLWDDAVAAELAETRARMKRSRGTWLRRALRR